MPTPVARELDLILTAPQQRVLDQLVGHVDPVTATVLAGELSLHHNTVREHLDVLVEHGLARRRARRGAGRGRPSWVYEAATARPGRRAADYLDLAEVFAENLSATSARPSAEAREIGRRWGTRLAASETDIRTDSRPGAPSADPIATSRRRLVGLLRDVGFAPEPNEDRDDVALRECPLLDSARAHPEVVCQVHQGLVGGALQAYGNTVDAVRLTPFSQPGACRLRLVRGAE